MSEPWPPAFMRTAPPTDPGTPTAHSNPVSPSATVRRASLGSGAPPPALTADPDTAKPAKSPSRATARPLNPASATSRLEPRPSTSTGASEPAVQEATRSSAARLRTGTKRRAGPPTR